MKTHDIITAILFATTLLVRAQEPTPPEPDASSTNYQSRPRALRRAADPSGLDALSANYQITIAGSLGKSDPIDVTLRGSSSKFDAILEKPSRRIEIVLRKDGETVNVLYSLGARIQTTVGNNVSYNDTNVTGSFIATLGEPFPILEVGDAKLTIQVDKISEKR